MASKNNLPHGDRKVKRHPNRPPGVLGRDMLIFLNQVGAEFTRLQLSLVGFQKSLMPAELSQLEKAAGEGK